MKTFILQLDFSTSMIICSALHLPVRVKETFNAYTEVHGDSCLVRPIRVYIVAAC